MTTDYTIPVNPKTKVHCEVFSHNYPNTTVSLTVPLNNKRNFAVREGYSLEVFIIMR